ncbi:MAG: mechanosensitive ion channel family protein [Crocosphaera sp.]|nr:mechanosensitive ion channel family protein [Crocosphaera sp.]
MSLTTLSLPTASQNNSQESLSSNMSQENIWLDLGLLFQSATGQSLKVQGNLKEGWVFLDGIPLFRVSAPNEPYNPNNPKSISKLQWRINEIEHNLAEIVDEKNFNPALILIRVEQLNDQPAIFAIGDTWKILLLTITNDDWQSDDTTQSKEELSQKRADIIRIALMRAYEERQPHNIRQEMLNALKILGLLIGTSLGIALMSRLLNVAFHRWQTTHQSILEHLKQQRLENQQVEENSLKDRDENSQEQNVSFRLIQVTIFKNFLRALLWSIQAFFWLGGTAWIFYLFYNTRLIAKAILAIPLTIILLIGALGLLKSSLDLGFSYVLQGWSHRHKSSSQNFQRFLLRIPTLNTAFYQSTSFLAFILGILWFLRIYHVPIVATFAGIGLLGFGFQNLIQDVIQGVLILWEDHYTQGDIVTINSHFGEVEQFNLRSTQLRTLDGEVVTFSHSSFQKVINHTKYWSRLNLGITVAYNTDLDLAINVINKVAQEMYQNTTWKQYILETPKVLGVDDFGDNSITIRLLIKTQPRKQWEVGREYRRRLKIAFEQQGISIPFPQRSIWFETPLITQG